MQFKQVGGCRGGGRGSGGDGIGEKELVDADAAAAEGVGHHEKVKKKNCCEANEEKEEGHYKCHYDAFEEEEKEFPLVVC